MPTRKLPNTDKMQYDAMKTAIDMIRNFPENERAVSKKTCDELLATFSRFEQIYKSREKLKHNNEYKALHNKARLYIRHYLQVLIMAVERGELPESSLAYYGLKPDTKQLPRLNSVKHILDYGQALFEADAKRILDGGKYVTNPSIAVVKVWFEKLVNAQENHRVQAEKFKHNKAFFNQIRHEAKICISKVWDEIEEAYGHLSPAMKRKAAAKYGVVYVDGSKERKARSAPQNGTLFSSSDIPEEEPEINNIAGSKPHPKKQITETKEKQGSMFY